VFFFFGFHTEFTVQFSFLVDAYSDINGHAIPVCFRFLPLHAKSIFTYYDITTHGKREFTALTIFIISVSSYAIHHYTNNTTVYAAIYNFHVNICNLVSFMFCSKKVDRISREKGATESPSLLQNVRRQPLSTLK